MASIEYIQYTVVNLRKSLSMVADADPDDLHRWLQFTNSAIEALNSIIEKPSLSRAEMQKCQTCMTHLATIQVELDQHLRRGGGLNQPEQLENRVQWRDVQSAFQNRMMTGIIVNLHHIDISAFMTDAEQLFESKLGEYLKKHESAKVNAELVCEFVIQKSGEETVDIKYFNTHAASVFKSTNLREWFTEHVREPILRDLEEFQERDSGWTLKSILSLAINVIKLNPVKGSSYIMLPKPISNKKACVNVQNNDNQCFKWAVLSALHAPARAAERVSKYRAYENELNFNGIEFPVKLKDVPKFERQNDVSTNVYMLRKYGQKFEVSPCHLTDNKKEKHVNLLIVQDIYIDENHDGDEDESEMEDRLPQYHYVWIKNISRLISTQVSLHRGKSYFCDRCLHYFHKEDKLIAHELECRLKNKCRINLPDDKSNILKFENHSRNEKVPFVIYADFECLLRTGENQQAFQVHKAYSNGFYLKCSFDDSQSFYKSYRQSSNDTTTPAEWFVEELKSIAERLDLLYENPKEMRLTDQEVLTFERATSCHICLKPFSDGKEKVRDHCHLTGR